MRVELIKPIGYCFGVIKAINLAKEIKANNSNKNIYVYGMLAHNNFVVDSLSKLGIKTIDIINPDQQLKEFNSNDIVIFTAHGHPKKYEEILKKNKVNFYDATCFRVQQNIDLIKECKEVIYIGKASHAETIAALSVNNNTHLYDINSCFDYSLVKTKDPVVINQTTLSFLEIEKIHEDILKHLPNAIITNEICDATKLRQIGIQNINKNIDAIIVVGSNESSNTNKLFELAKEYHKNKQVIKVECLNDLLKHDLNFKYAAIASGTSTPPESINEIKEYLERMN